jgi:large subunit ribosomal protein L21
MYAIIETGGKQYKVSQGDILEVELLDAKDKYTFDKVLLISNEGKVEIGAPYVKGATVSAKIVQTLKAPKVTTFKYKHKVNYHRTIGHRQPLTQVQIEEVSYGS